MKKERQITGKESKTKRPEIVIVRGENWEGIFINGALKMQDHRIEIPELLGVLRDFFKLQFEIRTLDCDYEWLNNSGGLPEKLDKVKISN